jgi:phosphoglycolate phosphatase
MIKKAVFFDFDGTLADTAPDFLTAANQLRAGRDLPPLSLSKVRDMASGGARAMLAGVCKEEEKPRLREEFLRLYEKTGYAKTTLFQGVSDLLSQLRADGKRWGIATNKPRRYLEPILENLRLTDADCVFAGDDCPRAKPHPDMLLASMAAVNLEARQCVYLGDDERDALAAAAVGKKRGGGKMPFVAVAWGYWRPQEWGQSSEKKAPVDGIAATPLSLIPLLKSLRAARR